MCHFITLIAPTEDVAALQLVMERHGRAAKPIDNPSIRKVLREHEGQYLTTIGHCDCGTVLARYGDTPEEAEERLATKAARMKRKGWSKAKIERAIEDWRKADGRPSTGGPDSLELWEAVLRDIRQSLNFPYAGLFIRHYRGTLDTELFEATRREVPKNPQWRHALSSLQQDEVTIFPFS